MTRPATSARESAEPPRSLAVDIVHEAGDWTVLAGDVTAAIDAAAAAVAREPAAGVRGVQEAVVALADDATVAALNAQFRGKSQPTNVLSFPSGDVEGVAIGDIILALETVRREAADLGLPPLHHVQHLTVHGLLHLLGFDHDDDASAEVMEGLEIKILAALGVADPYADSDLVRPS